MAETAEHNGPMDGGVLVELTHDMKVYDALPKIIREAIADHSENLSASWVAGEFLRVRKHGVSANEFAAYVRRSKAA